MDDQPEMIRKQMDETKSQLAEKMETLELQIVESVQSTGTAMNATAEAIQETAETVNEVVQEAVQSVSHAFDLRRQIDGHPVLVLGGAVAFGYLAFNVLKPTPNSKTTRPPSEAAAASSTMTNSARFNEEKRIDESAIKTAALPVVTAADQKNLSWIRLRDVAIGAMIIVVQEVVSRSVPSIVDYLTGPAGDTRTNGSEGASETESPPREHLSMTGEEHRLRMASSGKVRLVNSFSQESRL